MPVFTYRGVNKAGSNVSGERTAESKAELTALLKREQINVRKVSEKGKEFNIPTFGTGVDAKELKIDLSDVQDVVLSHFHDDHTTGLMTLRHEFAKRNPAALSRVHVAKGIFLERRGRDTNPMIAMKKEYEATGGKFIEHDKPGEIFPGVWLTGPVPRVYPEKNYGAGVEVAEGGVWTEDNVPDDQSLVFNTSRGLVLLAGCGHAGLINTLEYARKFIRPAPVDAAIGGFHLYNATDEQLN